MTRHGLSAGGVVVNNPFLHGGDGNGIAGYVFYEHTPVHELVDDGGPVAVGCT